MRDQEGGSNSEMVVIALGRGRIVNEVDGLHIVALRLQRVVDALKIHFFPVANDGSTWRIAGAYALHAWRVLQGTLNSNDAIHAVHAVDIKLQEARTRVVSRGRILHRASFFQNILEPSQGGNVKLFETHKRIVLEYRPSL
jgi:hypothetical protein